MLKASRGVAQADRAFLADKKIAIVASLFNTEICEGLLNGAVEALREAGLGEGNCRVFRVPGAFEVPLIAKRAAASGRFDGVVALGCVIRGETPHFEFVSLAATIGVLQAGLESGRPVSFGIITVNDEAQALARSVPGEFNKGREAVGALFDSLRALRQIEES